MLLNLSFRTSQKFFAKTHPQRPSEAIKAKISLMKCGLLSFLVLLSFTFVAHSQTARMRAEIAKSVNQEGLKKLKSKLELQHSKEEVAVALYLKKNPKAKRVFDQNGSTYYIKRIDENGNPVYGNTKNVASGALIKTDQLYTGGSIGVDISGQNMVAGVWDIGQVRATHELLSGKVVMQAGQTNSSKGGDDHQTHVTGTMVGKILANQPSARGIAYSATAKNYDSVNDAAEITDFAANSGLISNHSYGNSNAEGTPIWQFGAYDQEARTWDDILVKAPNYLPFIAIGNEQSTTERGEDGKLKNGNGTKGGYDMATGTSASKNTMVVGAVNGDKTMSDYSNWGPTDDGRVKPEVVAKGTGINSSVFYNPVGGAASDNSYSGTVNSDGTSYAAPAAAASALLLQQYYQSLNSTFMQSATLKALMITTTEDLGQPGPDSKFGWGLVNAEKAALTIKNRGTLSRIEEIATNPTANSTDEITRTVTASGCEPLVVAIGWLDDPGTEQTEANGVDPTASRLVYEFDVMVRQVGPNTEFRPWKPVSMANRTDAATLCTGWFDVNNNNYKQVRIANPVAGATYEIIIRKKTSSPAAARTIALIVTGTHLAPTGAIAQTFCAGLKVSDLAATGTGIKWYDAATAGNLLATTTALTNGTIYYASQTINGCESPRLAVTATVNTTAAPTGSATQTVASGSTIEALVVTGTAIKWYDAATGGNLLATTTALTNGTIYYASQTIVGCESARLAVTVTFAIASTPPPTGAAAQSFCPGAKVSDLAATGTAIKWYDAPSGENQVTANTVLVNGALYYATQTVSGIESTQRLSVTVTINALPTLQNVTGGGSVCPDASVAVGLSGSQTGVSYQLKRDGANVGSPVAGTGNALNFGNFSVVGSYTVLATNANNPCNATMNGTATITAFSKGFALTFINVGQTKSATKITPNPTLSDWSSQFITADAGPTLETSTQANPTLFFSENVNKTAPRYWTIHVDGCALGTSGSVSFDVLTTPEVGEVRSYNSHENNAPYFMYANRDGYTELFAQNHPAFGFYLDNGTGGNIYDEGLPKGLYKMSVRYWDMKGYGSLYPTTRKAQGNVLAYQEYWFRIQSKDGIGVGAARVSGLPFTVEGQFAEVAPNPVSNVLRLKVTDAKAQKVNVSLLDASGRAMLQRYFVPETNQHQEEFNVSEMANGMYFLKVNAGDKQATLKVVKVQ